MAKQEDNQRLIIDISWQMLMKLTMFAVLIWAVFVLKNILFLLFVVFIFVAAVNPTIQNWQRYMSRTLAVTLFYVIMLLIVTALSYLFIPKLVEQVNQLIKNFPVFLETIRPIVDSLKSPQYTTAFNSTLNNLSSGAQQVSSNVVQVLFGLFGGIATVIVAIVLSFYLLLEEKGAKEFFHQIMPTGRYQAVYNTMQKISVQLGAWIRGQLTVMLLVGFTNMLAFYFIGLPSPLPLGVWSGICEAIPYVGPFMGVLPGLALAIANGNIVQVILVVLINYVLIQQIQNFYVTPRVMGRAIGLSPVLVILSIMVGIALFGIFGAIIALPVAAMIAVIVREWPSLRKTWQQEVVDPLED